MDMWGEHKQATNSAGHLAATRKVAPDAKCLEIVCYFAPYQANFIFVCEPDCVAVRKTEFIKTKTV